MYIWLDVSDLPQYYCMHWNLQEQSWNLGTLRQQSLRNIINKKLKLLQSNWQNREHSKYFRNAYCVTTNHSKDQDTGTTGSHKTTNWWTFLLVVLSRLTGFFPVTQNISGVHGFPGLAVKESMWENFIFWLKERPSKVYHFWYLVIDFVI